VRYDQLISRQNLDLAWNRIATATNHQYKRFFRAPLLALEPARDELLRRLHRRLRGSWEATPPRRVYLPKPSGLQRPISLLSIEDQVVLQAVANAFAVKLRSRRAQVAGRVVFSNILNAQPTSIFFVQRWQETYATFQTTCENHFLAGYRWVAHFDLAAFYDTISHDLLMRRVSPRDGNQRTWDHVRRWLRTWSAEASERPFSHGIPQGPIASDFLAECFLLPIDEYLLREGIRYVRYVDDIRVFARTRSDAQQAVLLLERLCRNAGLIPQGGKFAIRRAGSVGDVLGALPSLAPPDDEGGAQSLGTREAVRLFEQSLVGRPYRIGDRSKARYVLYRAPRASRLTRLVAKLLPRHPEHVDAFVHYLRVCGPSASVERVCRQLLQEGTPYEYVRGEVWQLLSEIGSDVTLRDLAPVARTDLRNATSVALSWGALRFLLEGQRRGGPACSHRVVHQEGLVQALLVDALPEASFGAAGTVARLLSEGAPEAGACLAAELIARGLTHRDFGLRVADLDPVVQEVFRALGLVQRRRGVEVDQVGEILSRRFTVAFVPKWKHVLGNDYTHALQILSQAEFVYDASRSSWLQHQDSFNDVLVRRFIDLLATHNLPGARSIVDNHGVRLDYGVLLNPTGPFGQAQPQIADGLRAAHVRRNQLPASHPYDKRTGAQNRFLSTPERAAIHARLAQTYEVMVAVIDQAI